MVNVDAALAFKQLELADPTTTYLPSGDFVGEDMLAFWDSAANDAIASGQYSFVRAAGVMPSVLRDLPGGIEAFMAYEMDLNDYTSRHPEFVLLCMYDLEAFGGGVILDLLRTHPKLLLGGLVVDNPHFLSPN